MKIILKLTSVFGGALSVWMELHFFYSLLAALYSVASGTVMPYQDTSLMSLDAWLVILGIFLHYFIEENKPKLLKRGAKDGTKAVVERRSRSVVTDFT
jgi:hypothetical protein